MKAEDFVGADMARKFLQMGFTRARRYANHRGGKKYDGPVPADKKGQSGAHGRAELPRAPEDPEEKSKPPPSSSASGTRPKHHPEYVRQNAAEFQKLATASEHRRSPYLYLISCNPPP